MRLITTVVAVVSLAIAAPAIAGKGGNGNGGNSGSQGGSPPGNVNYSPSLSVSWPLAPASTSNSAPYVIEGCGYDASYGLVTVVNYTPIGVGWTGRTPDASGCISVSNFYTMGPGTYRVEAWQHMKNKDVVVATTGFKL